MMLCQQARKSFSARPRSRAISSSNVRSLLSWATELDRRMVSGGLACFCINRIIVDPIDATAITSVRNQIEAEPLANDASEEAPYRMLLPARCMDHRLDGCAAWRSQHRNDPSLFAIDAPWLLG